MVLHLAIRLLQGRGEFRDTKKYCTHCSSAIDHVSVEQVAMSIGVLDTSTWMHSCVKGTRALRAPPPFLRLFARDIKAYLPIPWGHRQAPSKTREHETLLYSRLSIAVRSRSHGCLSRACGRLLVSIPLPVEYLRTESRGKSCIEHPLRAKNHILHDISRKERYLERTCLAGTITHDDFQCMLSVYLQAVTANRFEYDLCSWGGNQVQCLG